MIPPQNLPPGSVPGSPGYRRPASPPTGQFIEEARGSYRRPTAALPRCTVCNFDKKPLGRDAPPGIDYCTDDCAGYLQDPKPPTWWPDEARGRRKVGDVVWKEPGAGFIGTAAWIQLQAPPPDDDDVCMVCEDATCREWATAFLTDAQNREAAEANFTAGRILKGYAAHVSECQMRDDVPGSFDWNLPRVQPEKETDSTRPTGERIVELGDDVAVISPDWQPGNVGWWDGHFVLLEGPLPVDNTCLREHCTLDGCRSWARALVVEAENREQALAMFRAPGAAFATALNLSECQLAEDRPPDGPPPLTVGDLLAVLKKHDPSHRVVVASFENEGYDDAAVPETRAVLIDAGAQQDYSGRHLDPDQSLDGAIAEVREGKDGERLGLLFQTADGFEFRVTYEGGALGLQRRRGDSREFVLDQQIQELTKPQPAGYVRVQKPGQENPADRLPQKSIPALVVRDVTPADFGQPVVFLGAAR